jgi:autotransporter-associated beta strand protein
MGAGTNITFTTPAANNTARGTLESLVALTGANAITQNVNLGAASGFTGNNAIIKTTADMELAGMISGAADAALVKQGTGTLILSGANTYSGTTTISAGKLQIGVNDALPTATTLYVDTLGVLDLNGLNQQVGSLHGSAGMITNSSVTPGGLTLNFTGTQSFLGRMIGPATLTLTGGGILNLVGTNNFSYTTVTNGSSLAVNGLHDGGVITVYSGSYLGGTGFVSSVVVNGGIYSPGNSPGTQTVANLTLTNSALLAMELGTNGYDMVIATNSLVLADQPYLYLALTNYVTGVSPTKIALVDWSSAGYWDGAKGYDTNQWFKLYDPGQSWNGQLLTNGLTFSVVGGNAATNIFTINYDEDFLANGGHMVTLTAVPEPGTASLLGMMGVAWLIRRLRRCKATS